jgi:hypothetical protein
MMIVVKLLVLTRRVVKHSDSASTELAEGAGVQDQRRKSHLGLEFVPKKGFIACEVPPTARDAMQAVIEIVTAHPGSNQSQIVKRAQEAGIGKHLVEDCLKDGAFDRQRGAGKEILYRANSRTPGP